MINLIYQKDGKGAKLARPVTTREEYIALRNAPDNAKNFYDARGGDENAKSNQIEFNYNDLLPDGVLKGCKHPSSTFAHDIDCGDAQEQVRLKDEILAMKDEIGLLELSGSARYGLHAVCRRQPGRTVRECQFAISMATHTEYHTNARGLARVMFTGPATEDNLFYLDDAIFEEPLTIEESEKEYKLLKERERKNQEEVPKGAKKANKHYRPWEEEGGQAKAGRTQGTGTSVTSQATSQMSQSPCATEEAQGVTEATDRTRFIFKECMKEEDVTEADFLNEGGRHNSVKNVLGLCNQLLTRDETLGMLRELMPNNWEDKNIHDLVEAFYTEYLNPNQRLNQVQKRIFKESKRIGVEPNGGVGHTDVSLRFDQVSSTNASPPEMPKKLPKLIQLLMSKTPKMYQPAVVNAVFPPLATHLCDVRFCYTDNVEHEATLMNCLMAPTGSGKGCIDTPIEMIMADIKRRDEENTRREDEWKKDCQRKGANKDKMLRPEGLVIQQIDSDMTKPALVTRLDEAEGHFVYVKLNELDLFEQLKGQTGKQHFQLMCLAFDPGAEYGQTRVGTQSVTARPKCRFNWNACTTIQKGRRFFSRVLTDGPISRINFCTIPDDEPGAEQPIYGKYDAEFTEALKPYIDNLVAARGLIECPQAYRLAKKLQEECADFARLSQDKIYWNLSHRAIVIAWLKACVLYVANGQQWEKSIDSFIRWSLEYDMYCKMAFFGEDIAKASQEGDRIGSRGPKNLLELLPDVFTIEDAKRVRKQQGKGAENTGKMVSQWKSRGYILQLTVDSFQKAPKYNKRKE